MGATLFSFFFHNHLDLDLVLLPPPSHAPLLSPSQPPHSLPRRGDRHPGPLHSRGRAFGPRLPAPEQARGQRAVDGLGGQRCCEEEGAEAGDGGLLARALGLQEVGGEVGERGDSVREERRVSDFFFCFLSFSSSSSSSLTLFLTPLPFFSSFSLSVSASFPESPASSPPSGARPTPFSATRPTPKCARLPRRPSRPFTPSSPRRLLLLRQQLPRAFLLLRGCRALEAAAAATVLLPRVSKGSCLRTRG